MAMKKQVAVFWVVTQCSVASQGEAGGSMVLRNVGILPQNYRESQPRNLDLYGNKWLKHL